MNKFQNSPDGKKFLLGARQNPIPESRTVTQSIRAAEGSIKEGAIDSATAPRNEILLAQGVLAAENFVQPALQIENSQRISNRHTPRLETRLTHSKQTTAPPSNRHIQGGTARKIRAIKFRSKAPIRPFHDAQKSR
jgi:hypothetical protein